jgi:hypothetical protein
MLGIGEDTKPAIAEFGALDVVHASADVADLAIPGGEPRSMLPGFRLR